MTYRFGNLSNQRLSTVSEYLKLTAERALSRSAVDFAVPYMGGLRTAAQQNEIYKQGCTKCDGHEHKSNHQKTDHTGKGMSLDIVPYINSIGMTYKAPMRYGYIGRLMIDTFEKLKTEGSIPQNLYLHWGGYWNPKDEYSMGWDPSHYELQKHPQKIRL